MVPFEGFNDADFDAFGQQKWSSNAYNLERLEVKLKLNALGKELESRLSEALSDQEMGVTEERPSIFNQHLVRDLTLFFYRGQEARKALGSILDKDRSIADKVMDPAPHHQHIILGVRINLTALEAGLWLHKGAWVDWKNAVERCRSYGEPDKLAGMLSALPDNVRYSRGQDIGTDAPPARGTGWETLVEGFEQADPWTIIGQSIRREDPLVADGALVGRLAELFHTLMPLRGFLGWSRQNDFHELKQVIKEHKEKAERQFRSLEVGDKVRIVRGLAAGRLGVVESIERRGVVKVRMGLLVMTVKMEELARSK